MSIVCPRCSHENPTGANFCVSCGFEIAMRRDQTTTMLDPVVPEDDVDVRVQIGATRDNSMLVVTRGPNAGSRFVLEAATTRAGRHPESDIFLDDVTVSRQHAEIVREGDSYQVRDVGSLNGTYVNRERIEQCTLRDGDELQVGRFRLVFVAGSPVREGGGHG